MKKIKVFTTGGTIASVQGEHGLAPGMSACGLLGLAGGLRRFELDAEELFSMDSSNIQPEHWQIIARRTFAELSGCDGVIVTHGTDTMAYTAAALSFMLEGLNKPVVLTGSQIPIGDPLSDAPANLAAAAAAIDAGMTGVLVAFGAKIINGACAVKTSTMDVDAFQSVNAKDMAHVTAAGLRVFAQSTKRASGAPRLHCSLCPDVFLLKLIPGTRPELFDAIRALGYKGVVIEAFGAGGAHYIGRDIAAKVAELCASGVFVAVRSQCFYGQSDISLYEVGQRLMQAGAVCAGSMSAEAAVTKMMWALGQGVDHGGVRELYLRDLAGELADEI